MADLHDRIEREGVEAVLATARTAKERRLIAAAAAMMAQEDPEKGYLHSGFCMAALPHRRPKDDLVPWSRSNGRFHLLIESGRVREGGEWRPVGVPYGPKARLILIYLQTQAVQTRQRAISMGESMSDWMHQIGLPVQGGPRGTIAPVREQARRVCRCRFTMQWDGPTGGQMIKDGQLIEGEQMWFPDDPRQGSLWPSHIRLSEAFFASLMEHAVPLDAAAVRHLKGSSLALDLYVWLAHRLHRLKEKAPVPWKALEAQVGAGYDQCRFLKRRLVQALPEVLAVYRGARVEVQAQGLLLHPSPPPVARAMTITVGAALTPKG